MQLTVYKENGVKLEHNTMSNWIIKAIDIHMSILYDEQRKHLFESRVVHADESSFEIIRDGRKVRVNNYM